MTDCEASECGDHDGYWHDSNDDGKARLKNGSHVRHIKCLNEIPPLRMRGPRYTEGICTRWPQCAREQTYEWQQGHCHQHDEEKTTGKDVAFPGDHCSTDPRRASHWIGRMQIITRTMSTNARADARPTWRLKKAS